MLKVTDVRSNSIAADLGIEKGDVLVAFDGYPAVDELDYLYYSSQEKFSLTVSDGEKTAVFDVEKDADEDLGIEIESDGNIRTCRNHCVFCFVDQMPAGMRESLYVKDDDYAMSFECGNFVTLTNLSDEELERIVRLHLSPLYVSVQTTDPELRCRLLRNRFAGKISEQLKKLAEGGIKMHCQAVIVPGVSDGAALERTARDLFALYPSVEDLAIVPTGITKYRENLPRIEDIDAESAAAVLDLTDALNEEFGVNFLLPADEYFLRAGRPFKDEAFYGDFGQIENGVGMTVKFLSEFYGALKEKKRKSEKRVVCVCGTSIAPVMEEVCRAANRKISGLHARPLAVVNDFFGETVTCTGLLTGRDILSALEKEKGSFDEVLLPDCTLREFTEDFLDGMTVEELKERLGFENVVVNRGGGEGVAKSFMREGRAEKPKKKTEKRGGKPVLYEKKYSD